MGKAKSVLYFCPSCGSQKVASFTRAGRRLYVCAHCHREHPRIIIVDPEIKSDTKNGQVRHFSVGAIIKKNSRYLLFKGCKFPFAWVFPSGHLRKEETPEKGVIREVKEETGLKVKQLELLFEEEVVNDPCPRGADIHYWWVYHCQCAGKLKSNQEAKPGSLGWYSAKEMVGLKFTNSNQYFLKKLGAIKNDQ